MVPTPNYYQQILQYLDVGGQQAPQGPNAFEQGAGAVRTGLGAGKTINSMLGANAPTWLGMAGKALPVAGTALGGYEFLKDRGTNVGNLLNGAGTGASIGSMFMPGIGTAVGAGVGALAGGIKDLINHFRVSPDELEGRQSNSNVFNMLGSMATSAQKQEAQDALNSGAWKDTSSPLSLIVMRDALSRSGLNGQQAESQAESWMHNLWDAEKGGASSEQQAFSPIANFFQSGHLSTPTPSTGQPSSAPQRNNGGALSSPFQA